MNNIFSILSAMLPNVEVDHSKGVPQLHFFTETHECSVTDFSDSLPESKEFAKRMAFGANDIVFVGDVRISATSR